MSSNGKAYGPANPHPLSQLRTELVWEGKYDEYGNRREVDVAGHSMPMQKIETIDQPRSEAAAAGQLEIFEKKTKRLDDFRNMLIWGDNKLVMASLLKEFKGAIDLIYIDPPFDVGADFTMNVSIGDADDQILKDQSTLEMVAYRDMWGKGTDSYLHMLFERLSIMHDLLSDRGSIYVHIGPNISHYVKALLDDAFGADNYRNEIVWKRFNFHADANRFGIVHDNILFYTKSDTFTFNRLITELNESYQQSHFTQLDETGRRYRLDNATAPAHGRPGKPMQFGDKLLTPPPGAMWRWSQENIDRLMNEGKIVLTSRGMPAVKRYLDEAGAAVHSLWTDIKPLNSQATERLHYDTQKPETLLERIIRASSNEGDLVADFFTGSGTTGAVAERLGRRWIMADLGRFAIHTSRKRLIDLQRTLHDQGKPYRAFDVYNLGRYERQWWQKASLQGADEEHRRVVLEFFQAELLQNTPSPLIHGRKSGTFCHVDSIDSMFARGQARAVAKAVAAAGGRECYCLAWEFEMDLRLTVAALEQELGVKLKLIQIPREIMERNRKSPPPFLEMAVLEADPVYRGQKSDRSVDIKLIKFLPSMAEVPTKELEALKERAVKSGFDFIDFWAIDFDWHPDKPFNHHWQDYRTRKDRSLNTVSEAGHKYPKPGAYTACVKVVDIFGCDTSITVEVKI
ncbi:MAG: DNA methyltransferase [Syntrophobacteraceae bacterium]|jgi:adenine-specific DNA-methyltransferase